MSRRQGGSKTRPISSLAAAAGFLAFAPLMRAATIVRVATPAEFRAAVAAAKPGIHILHDTIRSE